MVKSAFMRNWLILIASLTAADQFSKYLITSSLQLGQSIALLPNLNMTLVYN